MASAIGLSCVRKRWWSSDSEQLTVGEALDKKESTQVLHGGKDSVPKRMNCGSQELSSIHKTGSCPRGEANNGVEGTCD